MQDKKSKLVKTVDMRWFIRPEFLFRLLYSVRSAPVAYGWLKNTVQILNRSGEGLPAVANSVVGNLWRFGWSLRRAGWGKGGTSAG